MNYKILIISFIIISSCCKEKQCTNPKFCFTGPEALRIAYFDKDNRNMLDPTYPGRLEITDVSSKLLGSINFNVTSTIGGNIGTDLWHIDLIVRPDRIDCNKLLDCGLCINEECELYVKYSNLTDIDTLNILYERNTVYDENNCPCTNYPLRYINHNGNRYERSTNDAYGALITIRK